MSRFLFFLLAFFGIGVGLYPLAYLITDMSGSLLGLKKADLLNSAYYLPIFYTHIFAGAIALFVGWSQFSKKIRSWNLNFHRNVGKTYVIAVLLSGFSGFFIALFASGGIVAQSGFTSMSIVWLYTTIRAFLSVRKGDIANHQKWMIRSYAVCFAAVTLRLWLPIFGGVFHMEFLEGYRIIAWLCWVPNLFVAEYFVRKI